MATRKDYLMINYQIEFLQPFHLGTGLPNGLIHRAIKKDKNGYLYVPGSTIKGVLRQTCEKIAQLLSLPVTNPHNEQDAILSYKNEPSVIERVFGSRYRESTLFFDSAYLSEKSKEFLKSRTGESFEDKKLRSFQTFTRTQTSISRLLGTVKEQALWTSEFGVPGFLFQGKIVGYLEGIVDDFSEPEGSFELTLLVCGLYAIEQIGANHSTSGGAAKINVENLQLNDKILPPKAYIEKLENFVCYQDMQEAK